MTDPYAPPAAPPPEATARGAAPASKLVAVLLSVLLGAGAGHLYVRRPGRGLVWFATVAATAFAFGALVRPVFLGAGLAGLMALFCVPLGVAIACAVDAAKRAPERTARVPAWVVVLGAIGFFVGTLVIRSVLRGMFIEAFRIPSAGDMPTLAVGDHIFVDKLTALTRAPGRGELVVFRFPEHREQSFVKRVIAAAGDTIRVEGGRPWINGWEVPHCKVGDYRYRETGFERHEGEVDVEFLEDSAYLVFFDRVSAFADETQGPWRVKPHEVFVMGDNRHNSHDSRMWFGGAGGGVPFDDVRGHALVVWLTEAAGDHVDWNREGVDLTGRSPAPPPDAPDLVSAVASCMRDRPPRAATRPPAPKGP